MKKLIVSANFLLILTLLAACAAPGGSGGPRRCVQSGKPE